MDDVGNHVPDLNEVQPNISCGFGTDQTKLADKMDAYT